MRPGDPAPDFTLPDQSGEPRHLAEMLTHGPVVLFFYPAALTTGCTRETCHFRDLAREFAAFSAQRVGISMDRVARQGEFAAAHQIDFPLLSDADGAVARLYGVKRPLDVFKVRRSTFVIDTTGRVADVIHSEVSMNAHADRALAALAALAA